MKKGKFKIQRVHIIAAVAVVVLSAVAMVMSQGSLFSGMLVSPIKVKAPIVMPLPSVPTTPATPTMIAPASGSTVDYTNANATGFVEFKWNAVNGAAKYDLVLQQNNSTTDSTFHRYSTTSNSYKMPIASLKAGGFYMWFVTAYDSTNRSSANPSNYWTFTLSQATAPACPTGVLSASLSANQAQGGDLVGGTQGVSVGKWDFKASENLMLKDLTFNVMDIATINRVKLYMNGTTLIGSASGYVNVPNGVLTVTELGVSLPAGVVTTIEAKADINMTMSDGVSRPQPGDRVGLKLVKIDKVVTGTGVDVACGAANQASDLWGPLYTLQ